MLLSVLAGGCNSSSRQVSALAATSQAKAETGILLARLPGEADDLAESS